MIVSLPALDETIPQEERLRIIDKAIEEQQRAIDDLPRHLLALKSQRNASVPISRLPPETLFRIFSFAQARESDIKGRKGSLEWIKLTYVCRHWRSVAVNAPSLWVDLPIGHSKWVAEMLRRSKDSSLVINMDGDRMQAMKLALGDMHRVKELSIRHISSNTWNIIEGMLPVSTPRLERFCLVGQSVSTSGRGIRRPLEPISISEDILRETGPLRQLELEHCALNWIAHSQLLFSLTHLKLHRLSHLWRKSRLAFMDIFKSTPALEVLDLCAAFPAYETEQHAPQLSEDVYLPRLRTLYIEDSITPPVKAFFRNVTFPPTAMVKIVFQESDSGWHDEDADDDDDKPSPGFLEIIFGLARIYSNLRPEAAFRSLILQRTEPREYDTGVRLKLFTEILEDFDMIRHIEATPRLELVIYYATNRQEITQLLDDISTCGILDDVTHLCLPENNLSTRTMANTLGQLPCVYSVVVATDAAKSFLNAIVLGSRFTASVIFRRSGKLAQGLSFSCLSSIFLYDVIFEVTYLDECPEHPDAISTHQLQDILMHRCDFGVPIDKLFLHECVGFFAEDKELLREIVVAVDGDVETYSSSDESEEDEEDDEDENSDSSLSSLSSAEAHDAF